MSLTQAPGIKFSAESTPVLGGEKLAIPAQGIFRQHIGLELQGLRGIAEKPVNLGLIIDGCGFSGTSASLVLKASSS